jgi:hypothetical protein
VNLFGGTRASGRAVVIQGDNYGTVHTGDQYITIVSIQAAAPPSLKIPWELNPVPGNIESALTWRSRIPRKLHGRDAELNTLYRWALDPALSRRICVIHGEGGAGKSRLAFELAEKLQHEGWQAGQLNPGSALQFPYAEAGALLILDEPELYPEALEQLLRAIAACALPDLRLRVLLLCRNADVIEARIDEYAAGLRSESLALQAPAIQAIAWDLFQDAHRDIAALRQQTASAPPAPAVFARWLAQDNAHAQPLIILAYALNLLDDPTATELGATDILIRLAQRERTRLRREAEEHGVQAEAALLLKALAAIPGALPAAAVDYLATVIAQAGLVMPSALALQRTPLWRDATLRGLAPDRLAAVFLHLILRERAPQPETAAPWLWAVLNGDAPPAPVLHARLMRLAQLNADRRRLPPGKAAPALAAAGTLIEAVNAAIRHQDGVAASVYALLGYKDVIEVPLHPIALAATQAQVAVDEQRAAADPVTYGPALAQSLNNLSIRLAESGDRAGGLAAIQRAVEIYEALAAKNFAAYGPDLASSLNTLSIRLADVGERAGGLAAIQRAVEIDEALAAENFAAYGPDLALSLNNLSVDLAASGDRAGGLAAIQRAVGIREALAAENFAAYGPALALSLNNLSLRLAESGDRAGGLAAIQRAVGIYEALAAENFAAYGPDLALSLNNLSNRLAESGDRAGGLAAIQRAVGIYEALAAENFAAYGPDLAGSLNNLSVDLAESGDRAGGLAASRRAVDVYRPFLDENFAAFAPDGAMYLNNLANHLAESGAAADAAEAAALRTEVAAIRARLNEA